MTYGITSVGAYVPRYRLLRSAISAAHRWMSASPSPGKGSRAFCSWDEDAVTMAVEAARDCLRGDDPGALDALVLASTTHPYADFQNSAIVAGALGLPATVAAADVAGSQRCGTTALAGALRRRDGRILLVASDKPRAKPASSQEASYGAGAAAVCLGSEGVVATLLGSGTVTSSFADHFRASDADHDYFWEERWIRDEGYGRVVPSAVKAALDDAGLAMADIHHFVMPTPVRGVAAAVARTLTFTGTIADALDADCGHTGAAHPFMMLGRVLEEARPGQRILLVGFGQGADALVLEVAAPLDRPARWRGVSASIADRLVTEDYLRMLSFYGEITPEWGMRSEKTGKAALTEAHRSAHQLANFRAGICRRCGTVQFPQMAYCVNPACAAPASEFDETSLVDEPARILTFTADWLSYHPAPPLYVGFVQFENGARLLMETVDAPAAAVDISVPVRMVFRIKERDHLRGFNRYFWKATPVTI